MSWLPEGWRRALRLWRPAPERDVDAELAFHLEERENELIASGMAADAAHARAMQEFGDVRTVREHLVTIDSGIARRRNRSERWEWVGQDARQVLRSLRRSPGFVAMVALTLALGFGANAAIFSLLDRLFLQAPAGIPEPDRIHRIYRLDPLSASTRMHPDGPPPGNVDVSAVFSHEDFAALQRSLPSGSTLAGYTLQAAKLGRGSEGRSLKAEFVVGDYFRVLGVIPSRGRFFQGIEQHIETPSPVLVISDDLWRGQFGASPDIVGREVELNFVRYTIIGVTAPGFRGPDNDAADVWTPMSMMETRRGPQWYQGNHGAWIRLLATTGGASTAQLQRVATLAFRGSTIMPDTLASARVLSLVDPSRGGWDAKEVSIATRLAGVAAIIMLIACANVANLFLARGMRRRREIATRLALGVSRRRLTALLLLESVIVSLVGAVVALAVAWWGAAQLRKQLLPDVQWVGTSLDVRSLTFTLGLAVVTGVLVGLIPALRASRQDLTGALKAGAREGTLHRSRARSLFLVAQAALSVVLLAGAGLFVRSLHSVETEPIGYDAPRIVFAGVRVDPDRADRSDDVARRLPLIAEQLRRLPGVERTALSAITPMQGFSWLTLFRPNGDSMPRIAIEGPFTSYVSPDFFTAMGMRVITGRGLEPRDRGTDGLAMVVNETMARAYWPGRAAVGECLVLGSRAGKCVPVVGVVSNGHFDGIIEKPSMQFYLPLADSGSRWRAGVVVVRAAPGQSAAVAARIQRELEPQFTGWAEVSVHPMTEDLAGELRPWRTGAALFSAAGILALLVAMVGVYSTISYTFSQRTHEIGVRIALGAQRGAVVRLVVGSGVRVVCIGIAIGLALAVVAGRVVESMLYHTSPRDPVVLATVSLVLVAVAMSACAVPAWRAARVDPSTALRAD